jgi:hypothetical protein
MKKTMPNKSTFTFGSTGDDRAPSTQKVQKGTDLRAKPCGNMGKSKQSD